MKKFEFCGPSKVVTSTAACDIPEACGINVFETMANVGVILERRPDIVTKVMIVGKCKK